MHQRINVTLPEETIALLDRAVKSRSRSRLIDEAIRYYVETKGRESLRQRLEEGYRRNRKLNLELAEEGMAAAEEAWELRRR